MESTPIPRMLSSSDYSILNSFSIFWKFKHHKLFSVTPTLSSGNVVAEGATAAAAYLTLQYFEPFSHLCSTQVSHPLPNIVWMTQFAHTCCWPRMQKSLLCKSLLSYDEPGRKKQLPEDCVTTSRSLWEPSPYSNFSWRGKCTK